MWPKTTSQLAKYPTVVLTGLDADGYPFSLRCVPQPDAAREVLHLLLPEYATLQPGPASLLCHYHDDALWNQTNFVLRGTLTHEANEWSFKPTQFIEGAGAGMSMFRQIREGRGAAQRYLSKRNLSRLKIPWDQLKAIYDQAQRK
jgi:hypothetical protein